MSFISLAINIFDIDWYCLYSAARQSRSTKYVQMIRIQVFEVYLLLCVFSLPCSYSFWADYEVSLLRLLERVTNGTVIEISVTGAFS